MPTLDWLNRTSAFTTAAQVPYRLLDHRPGVPTGRIAVVEYKGAHLLNDPYEMEKRQVGELWAKTSGRRCLFGTIVEDRAGIGMTAQLDALLG
jgi:hypothetical protein